MRKARLRRVRVGFVSRTANHLAAQQKARAFSLAVNRLPYSLEDASTKSNASWRGQSICSWTSHKILATGAKRGLKVANQLLLRLQQMFYRIEDRGLVSIKKVSLYDK